MIREGRRDKKGEEWLTIVHEALFPVAEQTHQPTDDFHSHYLQISRCANKNVPSGATRGECGGDGAGDSGYGSGDDYSTCLCYTALTLWNA